VKFSGTDQVRLLTIAAHDYRLEAFSMILGAVQYLYMHQIRCLFLASFNTSRNRRPSSPPVLAASVGARLLEHNLAANLALGGVFAVRLGLPHRLGLALGFGLQPWVPSPCSFDAEGAVRWSRSAGPWAVNGSLVAVHPPAFPNTAG